MSHVEDIEEIRQLLARYGHLGDSLDASALVECFTEDCVVDANGVRYVGHDGIRESLEAYRPIYAVTPLRHVTVNVVIDVNGDEAEANSYFMLIATGTAPSVWRMGTYRDRLRRVDGRWLLRERVATSDGGPATGPLAQDSESA
jgi:ketosteroid isomerase-like protein